MPAITSQNLALAILKLVAARALPALQNNMVMANLVNRDFEANLASAGDTVNIPLPATMVANNIAEGASVTTQNPSPGNAQLVLNYHTEASFQIPDVAACLTGMDSGNFSMLDIYMNPAIIAIAESVETQLMNQYLLLTANTPVGTGNTVITEGVIDDAEQALFAAKVPTSERKFLVLSGDTYGDVRQISRFTENAKNGDGSAVATGQVGRLKDFDVYRSQLVAKPSTTTFNMAFAKDAFGLVTRRLPRPMPGTGAIAEYAEHNGIGMRILMSYAPNTLAQQFTVDILYGVGVIRPQFGVQVLS